MVSTETASTTFEINVWRNMKVASSPIFSPVNSDTSDNHKFQLCVFFEHQYSHMNFFRDDVLVYLIYFGTAEQLNGKFTISLLDRSGQRPYIQENILTYRRGVTTSRKLTNFIKRDFLMDSTNGFLVNNTLRFACEVILNVSSDSTVLANISKDLVLYDFGSMLFTSEFSDVILNFSVIGRQESREFPAHKSILSVRSPVFKAMFTSARTGQPIVIIDIQDIFEPAVFEQMLVYIYTGKLTMLNELDLELLVAAHKYQLDHLKFACERSLCSQLDIQCICQFTWFAHTYKAALLKSNCIDFILKHLSQVVATDKWINFIKADRFLVNEIADKCETVAGKKHLLRQ